MSARDDFPTQGCMFDVRDQGRRKLVITDETYDRMCSEIDKLRGRIAELADQNNRLTAALRSVAVHSSGAL